MCIIIRGDYPGHGLDGEGPVLEAKANGLGFRVECWINPSPKPPTGDVCDTKV